MSLFQPQNRMSALFGQAGFKGQKALLSLLAEESHLLYKWRAFTYTFGSSRTRPSAYAQDQGSSNRFYRAPVAQLDRASDYGSEGLWFNSIRAHFTPLSQKHPLQKFKQPKLRSELIFEKGFFNNAPPEASLCAFGASHVGILLAAKYHFCTISPLPAPRNLFCPERSSAKNAYFPFYILSDEYNSLVAPYHLNYFCFTLSGNAPGALFL